MSSSARQGPGFLALAVFLSAATTVRSQSPVAFDPIVIVHETPADVLQYRASLPEIFPPLRGFRAPILDATSTPWPIALPEGADSATRRAAEIVAQRLAKNGLLSTTVMAIDALGAAEFAAMSDAERLAQLREIGLPIELLSKFRAANDGSNSPDPLLAEIVSLLSNDQDAETLAAFNRRWSFDASRRAPHFRVAVESGQHDTGTIRLQLTRGDDWLDQGDGGSIDIARQLVEALPDAHIIASIREDQLTTFLDTSRSWPAARSGTFTLICEPLPVTQWAQDNGKAGVLLDDNGEPASIATLAPRYASRREEGSLFVPGDSFAMNGLAAAGHAVRQSPLLFQGGNLMAVRDPKSGRRILLIGEAEISRNIALGLSREETIDSFKDEFGVDECRILPAVSFHIDNDLCVRAVGDTMTAFVCDWQAGANFVLRAGVEAMSKHGHLGAADAEAAVAALDAGRPEDYLRHISPALARQVNREGRFSESFARAFSTSPVDSHVGNLRLFLVAMDVFVHRVAKSSNRHTQAYLRSFARQAEDHQLLVQTLREWGWNVVTVPGFGDGNRAINPINGIHARGLYLMPVIGGLYAALDDAASARFREACGPDVRIVPIRCGESQRRAGALHCAASVYPVITKKLDADLPKQDQDSAND